MNTNIKVSDYIVGDVTFKSVMGVTHIEYEGASGDLYVKDIHAALAHAINSHDELAEEVERLRGIITSLKEPDYNEDVPCYYDHLEASAWCGGYEACIDHIRHLVKEGKENE